jgi:vacuolar-type H+-ATPase subunit I/STV1
MDDPKHELRRIVGELDKVEEMLSELEGKIRELYELKGKVLYIVHSVEWEIGRLASEVKQLRKELECVGKNRT